MDALMIFLGISLSAAAGAGIWNRLSQDPDCRGRGLRPGSVTLLILAVLCFSMAFFLCKLEEKAGGAAALGSLPHEDGVKKGVPGSGEAVGSSPGGMKSRASARGVPAPVFSNKSGFYDEPFLLEISAGEGLSVRYTLDCSVPTGESELYEGPIRVYDRSGEPDRFRSIRNVRTGYLEDDGSGSGAAANGTGSGEDGAEPVEKAFVVRAAAVDGEGNASETVTMTYFVGMEKYRSQAVISLVADPDDLFGPERGIYVTGAEYDAWYEKQTGNGQFSEEADGSGTKNGTEEEAAADGTLEGVPEPADGSGTKDAAEAADGAIAAAPGETDGSGTKDAAEEAGEDEEEPEPNYRKRGKDWEREADFTLFKGGEAAVSQPVGIRIQGNNSREYELKRFSIFSRKEYSGSKWFAAPIFGAKKTHSVMTRNSFLNALSLELAKGRHAEAQPVMPAVMFLNGELWYDDYFLMEKYSTAYFSQKYGLSQDNIRMIKTTFWDSVDEESRERFEELLDFLEQNDMSDDEKYAEFGEMADIQSYIDYWCFNLYLDNEDAGDRLNVCVWRADVPENGREGDGRWRWALQDLDLTWGRRDRVHHGEEPWETDTFSLEDSRGDGNRCRAFSRQPIYRALRENPAFCRQFALTFMDLVNTVFRPEAVLDKIKAWENTRTLVRYRDYFEKRAEQIVPAMARALGLTGTKETVTVSVSDPEAGQVAVNTILPDLKNGSWSGLYYTDYPVTVTAAPNPGYRFVCWQISGGTAAGSVAEDSDGRNQAGNQLLQKNVVNDETADSIVDDETAEILFGEGGVSIHAVFEKKR